MLDRLLSIYAPHSCCGCGNVGSLLCDICKNDITSEPFSRCIVCLQPTFDSNLCSTCKRTGDIDDAWCVGVRDHALKELLNRYKFDAAIEAATICTGLLDASLPLLPADAVVVAVPTASARRRVRGFDHTAVIAKRLAGKRSLRYSAVLERTSSQTQHFKSRAERLKTAGASLRVRRTVPGVIVLVDDIYTTGATTHACVKLLKQSGAKKVFVAIIARQTLDDTHDLW